MTKKCDLGSQPSARAKPDKIDMSSGPDMGTVYFAIGVIIAIILLSALNFLANIK